jgi:fused signal recognition particle receptor
MGDEPKIIEESNNKKEVVENKQEGSPAVTAKPWDEARVVVFLIGICLLIEGLLIYYQAGSSQVLVSSVTGLGGLVMMLMAWLLPFEENESDETEESDDTDEEDLKLQDSSAKKITGTSVSQKDEITEKRAKTVVPEEKETKAPEDLEKKTQEVKTESSAIVEKAEPEPEPELTWFQRLTKGLTKTRTGFIGKLKKLVFGTTKIDDDLMDELEETLFEADVGVKTTEELLNNLRKKVEEEEIKDPNIIYDNLKEQLRNKLSKYTEAPRINPNGLTVFIIIGVNGVGKTTTIAKLANKYKKDGKKVILAAGDTFRAAAIDQISIWGERAGVEVIRGQEGGDPGALVFDAIHAAKKREADLLIIDTAGRMHVKANLMAELNKVMKIVQKESDGGPQEIFLVLDATTGQNAVQQAKQFNEIIPITGLVVTKLDGTAKGGVLFAVEEELNAPVKFIGVGEKMDDLMPFEPEKFLEALFSDDTDKKKESDYNVVK